MRIKRITNEELKKIADDWAENFILNNQSLGSGYVKSNMKTILSEVFCAGFKASYTPPTFYVPGFSKPEK